MAPKKKEKNLKRSNIITLKLTDIELAVLNEAADVTGLSRSEYMRKLLPLSLYIFIPTVLRYVPVLRQLHFLYKQCPNRI